MKSGLYYHLQDFRDYRSPNENFDYRHSSLRSTTERIVGVLKNTWKILKDKITQVSRQLQIEIIISCCALHNFSRMQESDSNLVKINEHCNYPNVGLYNEQNKQTMNECWDVTANIISSSINN